MWGRGVGVRGNEVRIPLGVCLEPDPRWHWFRGFAGSLFSFRIDGALAARRHFLCLCKESNQRKHTPGGTPCASLRVRERARNFRKAHPCAIRKRRPSRAAPFGFYLARSPCLMGTREREQRQSQKLGASFDLSGAAAHPPRSGGRTAGVCFFCLLFFAQAKKSRAPAASGTMPNRPPCLSKPTNATDVRIALTANAPAPREVPVAGLRCPSPQPLSPTGTSFGRRRERGFKTQALFCGRIWHTAWHITSTRPASSRTSPARNNCVRVRSTSRA